MINSKPRLNEIGLCCIDLYESDRWFREIFGLRMRGGRRRAIPLPPIQGGSAATTEAICWWLDAGEESPILALYQFSDPLSRLLPYEHHPDASGVVRLAFHVPDFDTVIASLESASTRPIVPIVGEPGRRHATVRNPDGVFVEVLEQESISTSRRPGEQGAVLRRVMIGTHDLAASAATFSALTTGAENRADKIDNCRPLFAATPGCMIELFAAEGTRAAVPSTSVLPDQGICRLEFSIPSVASIAASGLPPHDPLSSSARGPVAAIRDAASKVLVALVEGDARPAFADNRPTPAQHWVQSSISVNASADRIWAALNDHDRMLEWLAADNLEVTTPGSPVPAGYGAVRVLSTFGRKIVQQVTRIGPNLIGYRAIGGTPFRYHNGTVVLHPGDGTTQVDWTIRFETHDEATGDQLQPALQAGIDEQMMKFKAMVEAEARAR